MERDLLLFLDTFVVEEQNKLTIKSLRFKQRSLVSEIRIIPFGSVIESKLSVTEVLGTTNPASFVVKFYGCDLQSSGEICEMLSDYVYNELDGVASIKLSPPVFLDFLVIRGNYSIITLAVFGQPCSLSIQQLGQPALLNFSIPPPPLAPPVPHLMDIDAPIQSIPDQFTRNQNKQNWQSQQSAFSNITQFTLPESIPKNVEDIAMKAAVGSSDDGDESPKQEKLYEYDDLAQQIRMATPTYVNDPRLDKCRWTFDLYSTLNLSANHQSVRLNRLPNPSCTPFEVLFVSVLTTLSGSTIDYRFFYLLQAIRWILTTSDTGHAPIKEGIQMDHRADGLFPPAVDDLSKTKNDADTLLAICGRFGIDCDKFDSEWVLAIEDLAEIIPSGLAYLSLHEKDGYDLVIMCLMVWIYVSLDVKTTLKQIDPAYILRQLRAGIELLGVIFSTTNEDVCARFLSDSPIPWNFLEANAIGEPVVPTSFQAQHVLLSLLASPLLKTPVRLSALASLEGSLSLPSGMRAFIGRDSVTVTTTEEPTPYQKLVMFLASTHVS